MSTPPELILASTSPYRRATLDRLGLPYRAVPPEVDEDAFKARGLSPRVLAETLAVAKAEAVGHLFPEAVVIGCDQVAAIDGRPLGKAGTHEAALAQLCTLSGREHELITAMAVHHRDKRTIHVDVTTLLMRPLHADELVRYIDADRPLDCAGSYKLEARGIALFERIETADYTAIVGLPLIALTTVLRSFHFLVP